MSATWWDLPGPKSFIDNIVESWIRGQHTVICLPLGVYPGLRKACRDELERHRRPHWAGVIEADDGTRSPRDYLQHELSPHLPPHGPVADMLTTSLAKESVIWVERVDHNNWPVWQRFMVELEAASRGLDPAERTIVALCLEGLPASQHPSSDVCLAVACWSGMVDSVDALIFSAGLCRDPRRSDDDRFLRALTIANLALWDGQVAEMLAGLGNEDLFNPQAPLLEYATAARWEASNPSCWENGTCHAWHNRTAPHSAWLALAGKGRELQRRRWKGQAQALLPFVEEERSQIIERTRRHLQVPYTPSDGNTIHDAEALEIGHLYSQIGQLNSVDATIRRKVRVLRDIRNALAHLEPVPVDLIFDRVLQGRFGRD